MHMQMRYNVPIDGIIYFVRRVQSCDDLGGPGNITDKRSLFLLWEEKQFCNMISKSNYTASGIELVTHQIKLRNTKSPHKKH